MQRCNKVRFLYKYSVSEENSVFGEVSHWEEEGGGVGRRKGAGWALIRGRVLFRINTVITFFISLLNVISCGTFGKKMFYHLQQGNDKSDQKISP